MIRITGKKTVVYILDGKKVVCKLSLVQLKKESAVLKFDFLESYKLVEFPLGKTFTNVLGMPVLLFVGFTGNRRENMAFSFNLHSEEPFRIFRENLYNKKLKDGEL